ncbi:uncharacterized protein LOC144129921 [Amblyomma americanum]
MTTIIAPTVPTAVTTPVDTTPPDGKQPSWHQVGSAGQGGHRRSSLTVVSIDSGCRKRVFCEAARALTYIFPLSKFWQGIVRDRPAPENAYFAAWSKGIQSHDCSQFYPDCSDSPARLVLPVINEATGPKGFVGSFLERLVRPRGADAPRKSLVMQKLREGDRRLAAEKPRDQSDDFRLRRA